MNANLAHAEVEGGPRNGVMTGVDDFIAAYDKPLRLVVLPIFFGLAIVVEEARLARQPALAAKLEWLDSAEGKDMLLRLGENIRVDAVTFDQAMIKQASDRAETLADRYLETVTRGIVAEMTGDEAVRGDLDHLHEHLDTAWAAYLRGDLVVIGARSGAAATFLAAFLEARDPDPRPRLRRKLWIAGSGPLDGTKEMLDRFDLLSDRARLLDGAVETAVADITASPVALIHLGRGEGASARAALDELYPRLATGGLLVIDDISDAATSTAIDAYRSQHSIVTPIERAGPTAAHWRKD